MDNQIPAATIEEIGALNFADWRKIASASDNSEVWAFFRWIENADKAQLEDVSRAEIKAISDLIGYGSGFVFEKINERC